MATKNDGIISGATYDSTEHRQGKYSLLFNGTTDYVEIPHDDKFLGANLTNGFTISAWICLKSIGEGGFGSALFDKSSAWAAIDGFCLTSPTLNRIGFSINGTSLSSAPSSIVYNIWYHILVTLSSNGICSIYINGILDNNSPSTLASISTITTTNNLRIGQTSGGARNTDGWIDDVRIFDRPLPVHLIKDLAAGKDVRNGLIGQWNFEEGSGTIAKDTSAPVFYTDGEMGIRGNEVDHDIKDSLKRLKEKYDIQV